jgi:hypothetical protein
MEEKPPYRPSLQTFPPPQEFVQNKPSFVQSPLLAILTPWSLQLIAYARQIDGAAQHSFAVVLAHAACEWATEDALRRLLNRQGLADDIAAPILRAFTVTSLTDKRVRKLFKAMTGASPGNETWWKAWEQSRHLRNQVAHSGFAASSDQALEVLSLAESCVRFITKAADTVTGAQWVLAIHSW